MATFQTYKETPGNFAGLLGPCPPFSVCPECGTQSEAPWLNPILDGARRMGMHNGDVHGGRVLCAPCEPIVLARQTKRDVPQFPAGTPREFQAATLENFDRREGTAQALRAASDFLAGDADLFLTGPVGTGKTRLACSIANTVYRRSHASAMFIRVPELMITLQDAMHREGERASLGTYADAGLLVLDDVGVEKGSDYSGRTLQTLYDMRRDHGRRTIWTSNLDLEGLSILLGDDRLPSRIAGAADVIYLGGDDQRAARGRRPRPQERRPWDR